LLVYLLLYRGQPQPGEHLADLLLAENTSEQSKNCLRKALWQLQSILEPHSKKNILSVDGDWVHVDYLEDFWLHIEILEKTFKNTKGIRGKDLEEGQAKTSKRL